MRYLKIINGLDDYKIPAYLGYRYSYREGINRKDYKSKPIFTLLEVASACNIKCPFCFQSDSTFTTKEFMGVIDTNLALNVIDEIDDLKITVRKLNNEDIKERKLPNQTKGLVITKIEDNSPLINSIEVNSIIIEAQKKKIKTANDLNQIVNEVLKSNQKTILLVIYNSQNQRRYIGVKLD